MRKHFSQVDKLRIGEFAVRLFNAYPEFAVTEERDNAPSWKDCVKHGFVVIDRTGRIVNKIPREVYDIIDRVIGSNAVQFNHTFYKDYEHVATMPVEQRLLEQMLHYFSTYGMEMLGFNSQCYIPVSVIKEGSIRPEEMTFSVDKLKVIRMVDGTQFEEYCNEFARTIAKPNPVMVSAFQYFCHYLTIGDEDIKSYELKVIYYRETGAVPAGNINFLRYCVYETTGSTMLIKNKATVNAIKHGLAYGRTTNTIVHLWENCNKEKMAEIFFRYKPLFLAFRANKEIAPIINRIRRLADTYHRPLTQKGLQNVTQLLREGKIAEAKAIIKQASNRDIVKVVNALAAYLSMDKNTPMVYNIRNGRAFVQEVERLQIKDNIAFTALITYCFDLLSERLSEKYRRVMFILPENISYAAPTSEKQMVANYPWGTRLHVNADEAFSFGVHWTNVQDGDKECRVDLDLHMMGLNGQHLGWNSYYHNEDCVYSGDMTDAPLPTGAAEAYYIKANQPYSVSLHNFSGVATDYKIFASTKKVEESSRYGGSFVYDPKTAIVPAIPCKIGPSGSNENIGLLDGKGDFVFYGATISSGRVPAGNYTDFIKAVQHRLNFMITVEELLADTGCVLTDHSQGENDVYINSRGEEMVVIDLSPENLNATTLLKLVDGTIADQALAELGKKKEDEDAKALKAVQAAISRR